MHSPRLLRKMTQASKITLRIPGGVYVSSIFSAELRDSMVQPVTVMFSLRRSWRSSACS